jgi:hypothetical protein
MKKFALVIAFALLATVPVSAAEISKAAPAAPAAPAMTPVQQTQEAIPLFVGGTIIPPKPRCYTLNGTSCSPAGATTACTDACRNNLSCTCVNVYGGPFGTTVIGHQWHCSIEC